MGANAGKGDWSVRANRTEGSVAVGGRLSVVDGRLVFAPHAVERSLGQEDWSVPLQDIRRVAIEPRSGGLFSGGLRRRLRVEVDGGPELFVVNRVRQVAATLEALVAEAS